MTSPFTSNTDQWLNQLESLPHNYNLSELKKVCEFITKHNEPHEKLPYASSAIEQGLTMADILIELKCDEKTLMAAIVYPTVYYKKIPKEAINKELSQTTEKLTRGVERIDAIHNMRSTVTHANQQQIDNLRKMLLAMADDARVVLIKLAEQLAILMYLKHCSKVQQQQIAKQTLQIYAPLANRLGISQIKWQLEDFAFRYLKNEEYLNIAKALNGRRKDREIFIKKMIDHLQELFHKADIKNISISGRAKHIYSIYRKLSRKHIDISQLYDSNAFRVLVPTIEDCYTALSIVHSTWQHIPEEFDDYIAKPKANGYQSLHTAVIGPNNINVEVQIRTQEMHDKAELGVAAHWKYKEGEQSPSSYENKIAWLREVMDWQKEVSDEDNTTKTAYSNIFEDRVYVFTPNGDIVDLPNGATPLDFAYYIHSEVGHRCKGAQINNKLVPLTYTLKTGDQVHIQTTKQGHPSRDWLNPNSKYLATSQALSKVKHWFKKQDHQYHLEEGQALWDKHCRKAGLQKADIKKALKLFHFKTIEELLVAIGAGEFGIATVINQIKQQTAPKPQQEPEPLLTTTKETSRKTNFTIEGVDNLLTQLARCCKPIPGDPIIGYITKGRGVTIHHQSCRNIQQAVNYRPQRIIDVHWGNKTKHNFAVDITIIANDRAGLLKDITSIIANEKLTMIGINSHANKLTDEALISITLEVNNLESLGKAIKHIKNIDSILHVERK